MKGLLSRPDGLRGSATYLEDLESLRGVAIALVFVFHYDACIIGTPANQWVSPWRAYVSAGHTGVSLFFILSAFLLSRPFLEERAGGPRVSVRSYFARRALRILPLYSAAVGLALAVRHSHPGAWSSAALSILFLNQFDDATALRPFSSVWWSLATEAQFYVLLPLVALSARSSLWRVLGLAVAALLAGGWVGLAAGRLWLAGAQYFLVLGVLGRSPLFACGIALCWLYRRRGPRERWGSGWGPDACLLVAALLLGLLLSWVSKIGWVEADFAHPWWHVPEGLLWSAIIWLILTARLRLRRLLSNRILTAVGVLSYSIYMLHYPIMDLSLQALRARGDDLFLGWGAATGALFPAIAAATLSLSLLTYRLVERPFLVRKSRLRE